MTSPRIQYAIELLGEADAIASQVAGECAERREREVARRQAMRAAGDAEIAVSVPPSPVESAFRGADELIATGITRAREAEGRGAGEAFVLGQLRGFNRVARGVLWAISPEHATAVYEEVTRVCQLLAKSTGDEAEISHAT